MKPIGFIVEQKNVYCQGTDREHYEWVHFSHKIYKTQEIAEDAYIQSPYRNGVSGYNVEGRIIPVYRKEKELPILIKI